MYHSQVVDGTLRQYRREVNVPPQHHLTHFKKNSSFSQTSSLEGISLSQLCTQNFSQPAELSHPKHPMMHTSQECVRDGGHGPNGSHFPSSRSYTKHSNGKQVNIFGGRGTGSSQRGLSLLLSNDLLKKCCHTQPKTFTNKQVLYDAPNTLQQNAGFKGGICSQGVTSGRQEVHQAEWEAEPQYSSMEHADSKTRLLHGTCEVKQQPSLLLAPSTVPRRLLAPVSAESQNCLVSEMDSELKNMTYYCQSRMLVLRELSPTDEYNISTADSDMRPITEEDMSYESPIANKDSFEGITVPCDGTPSSIASSVRLNNALSIFSLKEDTHRPVFKVPGSNPTSIQVKDSTSFRGTIGAPPVSNHRINHKSDSRPVHKFPSLFTLLSQVPQDCYSKRECPTYTGPRKSCDNALHTPPVSDVTVRISGAKTPRPDTPCKPNAPVLPNFRSSQRFLSQELSLSSLGYSRHSNEDQPGPTKKRRCLHCDLLGGGVDAFRHNSAHNYGGESAFTALTVDRCQPPKSSMNECLSARLRLLSDNVSDMRDGIVEVRTIMCPSRPLCLNLDILLQLTGPKTV